MAKGGKRGRKRMRVVIENEEMTLSFDEMYEELNKRGGMHTFDVNPNPDGKGGMLATRKAEGETR